jgi:hypothetical protein
MNKKTRNGIILGIFIGFLFTCSLFSPFVTGDSVLEFISDGGSMWIVMAFYALLGAIGGGFIASIKNSPTDKYSSKFKDIQFVIAAFSSLALISFVIGVILSHTLGHSTAFLAIPTYIWVLPFGEFILPILGFISFTLAIVHDKTKIKFPIILMVISITLLISPYFYNPAINIENNFNTITTVTDSLAPTSNYFKRVAQYERILWENGCQIDLLSWSEDSINLLFDVAPKGNCPYEGLYTWDYSSKILYEGNPNQLPIDIIAPWLRDNPDYEKIGNVLPDIGYYIVDVLPAPDGKKYAFTSDWFHNEDVFVFDGI